MADRGEEGPMRGRGAEFETVLGLLDGTQQGQGRVLLVGGEPGTGKSLLLARVGEEAGRRGFRVVAAAAGELSPAPLLDGLVSAGPVLVTVDNVQWADLATTQALRSMSRLLASYPLSWILAVGTSPDAGPGELLFGLLESDGAARISFGPLDHEAQVALIGDVLGAVPDQTLIELAADAAGNPLVLAEAFRGLRDEDAIVVRDGHASLAPRPGEQRPGDEPDRDPGPGPAQGTLRSRQAVRGDGVDPRGSFRLEDVGEMLSESPGALLAAPDEALSAYLLVVRADGLVFQHEFIRQAVARMLAEPVQQALHWQYGRMLLGPRWFGGSRGVPPAAGGPSR
jgi:AAA ATPase domain